MHKHGLTNTTVVDQKMAADKHYNRSLTLTRKCMRKLRKYVCEISSHYKILIHMETLPLPAKVFIFLPIRESHIPTESEVTR